MLMLRNARKMDKVFNFETLSELVKSILGVLSGSSGSIIPRFVGLKEIFHNCRIFTSKLPCKNCEYQVSFCAGSNLCSWFVRQRYNRYTKWAVETAHF